MGVLSTADPLLGSAGADRLSPSELSASPAVTRARAHTQPSQGTQTMSYLLQYGVSLASSAPAS